MTPDTHHESCSHDSEKTIKRARDSHEAPEWENAIITQCRDCGEYNIQ